MYVFLWVHMHVYVYACGDQRLMLGILIILHSFVWDSVSLMLTGCLYWLGSKSQGSFFFNPPRPGVTDIHPILTFTWELGKQVQVLILAQQTFYQLSHCQAPQEHTMNPRSWCMDNKIMRARKAQTADEVVGGWCLNWETLSKWEERVAEGGLNSSQRKVAAHYDWDFPSKPLLALIKRQVGIKPFAQYW